MLDEVLPAPSHPQVGAVPAGPVPVGSEPHKRLFCALMIDRHESYEPDAIAWPVLDDDGLARLRALPFWHQAHEAGESATATLKAFARQEGDPLIRQAMALHAYEENRHARLIVALCRTYDIALPPLPPHRLRARAPVAVTRLAYRACFDGFLAFGLFAFAKDSRAFDPALVAIFERMVQEDARHILFIANWLAWRRRRRSRPLRAFPSLRQAGALLRQITRHLARARKIARAGGRTGEALGDRLRPRAFLELCLYEHERRLAGYDPRLTRPAAMPRLARAALRFTRAGNTEARS